MTDKTTAQVLRDARALVADDAYSMADAVRAASGRQYGPLPDALVDVTRLSTNGEACIRGCICPLVSWEGVSKRRATAEVLAAFDKAIALAEASDD